MAKNSTLRQRTIIGVLWTFFDQILRVGIQSLTTLMLAWFLLPEDFGLMAMISVFFSIANSLIDSGFSQALIRKKSVSSKDFSTAFYLNILISIVIYFILFLVAPIIAGFYNESRLVMLVRIVGIVVIINSFQLVQVADLTRRLDFKVQFKISIPSAIFSGVIAIMIASMGFGVWSLVAQMLLSSLTTTVLYWMINRWRPSKDFSLKSFHEMFSFGSKLTISGIIDTIFQNLYTIVIGKLFLATIVGQYFFAQTIQQLVVKQITGTIQKVTYPALSSIQDDSKALKESYRKIIQVITYIVIPSIILLIVMAEPIFTIFFKEEWLPAVPYLQLLCVSGIMYPIHSINLNILKVKGRSDLFLYLEVVKKIMILIILLISIRYGIYGILMGQIVSSVLAYIPNSYFSVKLINYSVVEQLHDFVPTILLAVAMGCFMYVAGFFLPFGGLAYIFFIGIIGVIFYILLNHFFKTPAQRFLLQIMNERYLVMKSNHDL